jgi:hypothetical protein
LKIQKSKIQNPKSKSQNSKIQNPKTKIQNPKSKIQLDLIVAYCGWRGSAEKSAAGPEADRKDLSPDYAMELSAADERGCHG